MIDRISSAIVPPSALGLIGGGQLGRMTAIAARAAGYRVHALDPDPLCAIRSLADKFIAAGWDDAEAAKRLARNSDVVTFEIEKVSVAVLQSALTMVPVRPGPAILELVQNRLRQKSWLQQQGFPVGPFKRVRTVNELLNVAREFGRCFLKAAEGGYDGRSQVCLEEIRNAEAVWGQLANRESIAEKAIDLEYEISVLVARRLSGEVCVYPPAMNRHENQILTWSVIPAPIDPAIAAQAQQIAQELATMLDLQGLLTVEMFVTKGGQLLINEMAPRTHNSYHASERACATGQFEQLIRSICNLPLGSPKVIRPTAIVNLLGDLWAGSTPPDVAASLLVPETRLHLYGKSPARPGRKMGHISAAGESPEQALQRVLRSKQMLVPWHDGSQVRDAMENLTCTRTAAGPYN